MGILINTTSKGTNIDGTTNASVTSGLNNTSGNEQQTGAFMTYATTVSVAGTLVNCFDFTSTSTGYVWIVTAVAGDTSGGGAYGTQRLVARNFSSLRSTSIIASGNTTSTTAVTTSGYNVRISQGGSWSGTKVYSVTALRII